MIRKSANLIAQILHPILMPAYLFLILGYCYPSALNNPGKNTWLLVSFMFTITTALPLINLMLLRSMGILNNTNLTSRQTRLLPVATVTLIYLILTLVFYFNFHVPHLLKFLVIVFVNALAASMFLLWKTISMHSLAAGAVTTLLLHIHHSGAGISIAPPALAILGCGLIMSAQLYLQKNQPTEIYAGLLTGCMVTHFSASYFL